MREVQDALAQWQQHVDIVRNRLAINHDLRKRLIVFFEAMQLNRRHYSQSYVARRARVMRKKVAAFQNKEYHTINDDDLRALIEVYISLNKEDDLP